jgi:uncharacterized protein DUF4276
MKVLVVAEGKHEQSGALGNFLQRLGGDDAVFEFDRVANNRIRAFHGKGDGFFKRSVRWLLEAQKRGFDALILLIDEDGDRKRVDQMARAQNFTRWQFQRALGVAVRTFDAWMLADETALASVLGHPVDRQRDPETIHDPKQVCAGLLETSRNPLGQAEMYARVAQEANIEVIEERCPRGFVPFASRVRAIFQ